MALLSNAKYAFGLTFARFIPLNDDMTIPTPSSVVGGAGPFDFSGVTISAVGLKVKLDNAAEETFTVDLSAAADPTAVTVDEIVSALVGIGKPLDGTDYTAEKDVTTGRIKFKYIGTGSPSWMQVYGELAKLVKLGQGFGTKFVKSNTLISCGETPTQKDEETITVTDARGKDTELVTDGYRTGFTATIVDSAEDWELAALIEGGAYDETTGIYEVPTSEDSKLYFYAEIYYSKYASGRNNEGSLVGYVKKVWRNCKGAKGESTHERGWMNGNYTVTGISYKDKSTGKLLGDSYLEALTVEEYEALDLENV